MSILERSNFSDGLGLMNPWRILEDIGSHCLPSSESTCRLKQVGLGFSDAGDVTGKIEFTINQGGIRNAEISQSNKNLFRQYVWPYLQEYSPQKITLNFANGLLMQVNIESIRNPN